MFPGSSATRRSLLGMAGVALALNLSPARASHPEAALLKVDGHGVSEPVYLDLARLDALPQQQFSTTTLWTVGVQEFSGPSLADVLSVAKAEPGNLSLMAANNYSVTLERDLIEADVPIIATRIAGRTFGTRDRGPLWLVFPYDSHSRYRTEPIYAASIWQLTQITVLAN